MYRPLSHNERVTVNRVLYEERGMNEGMAASFLMIYTGMALREDIAEFDYFQTSEKQRRAAPPIETSSLVGLEGTPAFFTQLDAVVEQQKTDVDGNPASLEDWFFGDESLLNTKHKRLRVMFFNSSRYRTRILHQYIELGVVTDVDDIEGTRAAIALFNQQYPGTRQGVITLYEIYFGDTAQFSYRQVQQRNAFLTTEKGREDFLAFYKPPLQWSIEDIKEHLRASALASGSLTQAQIDLWNKKGSSFA